MNCEEKKKQLNRLLFRWHKTHYRDMPWRPPKSRGRGRANLDPYHVLVSEIMLQQTQVDRVREKYAEFLKKFPNVHMLARAPLGDVLRVWSGLGYNRRARYLHECAKRVVREHSGKFPDNFEELKKLPGIGLSTAGALLAFSFGKDTPMIDTNIRRILVRGFFKKKIPSDKELYVFAQSLIPTGMGMIWNYAMLDLGATYCTARNHSNQCPFMKLHGAVGDFQYKKPQKKFAGSRRQVRGRILRFLTEYKAASIAELAKAVGKTRKEIREIVLHLNHERMVTFLGDKVALPR